MLEWIQSYAVCWTTNTHTYILADTVCMSVACLYMLILELYDRRDCVLLLLLFDAVTYCVYYSPYVIYDIPCHTIPHYRMNKVGWYNWSAVVCAFNVWICLFSMAIGIRFAHRFFPLLALYKCDPFRLYGTVLECVSVASLHSSIERIYMNIYVCFIQFTRQPKMSALARD